MTRHVALLLHLYQPPTQDPAVTARIDGECYTPLCGMLARSGARLTVNINYSLTEQLADLGSKVPALLSESSVEFCDSGAYHPILPLLPEEEVVRQLSLNGRGNSGLIQGWLPTGVFPPEMAYGPGLAGIIAGAGYSWTITDDVPWVHSGRPAPFDRILSVGGLRVFLRSNFWSNRIAFHGTDPALVATELLQGLSGWSGGRDCYVVLALDGETFGHHRPGAVEGFLGPFLEAVGRAPEARLSTLGELVDAFPPLEAEVPAGSWSTTPADMERGVPWPLWDDPAVPDHAPLRRLTGEVLAWARSCAGRDVAVLADRMLYSCPFWWASPGRYDAVQVRRGVSSALETAFAAFRESGDRKRLDGVMALAGAVPSMSGRGD